MKALFGRSTAGAIDWATLMHRVWGWDVLACPRCEGRMKFIAVIKDREVIVRILERFRPGIGTFRFRSASRSGVTSARKANSLASQPFLAALAALCGDVPMAGRQRSDARGLARSASLGSAREVLRRHELTGELADGGVEGGDAMAIAVRPRRAK